MLNGRYYICPVLNETTSFPPMSIDFNGDHDVDCTQLGEGGRFNEIGQYAVMAFGDITHFNGNTSYSLFVKVDSTADSFEGVMLDHHSGQRYGCVAERGTAYTPSTDFGDFEALPQWEPTQFFGEEQGLRGIHQPNAYFQFSYEGSQIGHVTAGAPHGIPRMSGLSTNLRYPRSNEELLVFGTDGLWVYGAVIDRSNPKVKLTDGIYMSPFSGSADEYGSWKAEEN